MKERATHALVALTTLSLAAAGCASEATLRAAKLRAFAEDRGRTRANIEYSAESCKPNGPCAEPGYHYFTGSFVPRDEARGRAMLEPACAADDMRACPLVGYAWLTGRGGEKDEARGLALLHASCKAGVANGYAYLGIAHEEGLGGLAKDPAAAARHYLLACNDNNFLYGSPLACARLGVLFQEGRGVERSEYWAGSMYLAGCKRDEPDAARIACLRGAALFERGFSPGVVYDSWRHEARPHTVVAREMREIACSAGIEEACSLPGAP